MAETLRLSQSDAHALAVSACLAAGADEAAAQSLADATLSAHLNKRLEVGFPHFLDYLAGIEAGRINGKAAPRIERPLPGLFRADADGGIAQLGFDRAFADFTSAARTLGAAIFTQRKSFTTGELGYYVRRLAKEGLVAIAFTNANAFMAPAPGMPKVYSTNPLAFAYPLGDGHRPVVIDQSSSATAFVNIAAAARKGEKLEQGIAADATGNPTTDPAEAIRGALLPFGGRKGANIALMVELMAVGLAGASWSRDMPDFQNGNSTLDAGLTVIAMLAGVEPDMTAGRGADYIKSLKEGGIHVPGTGRLPEEPDIVLDAALVAAIRAYL